MPTLSQINVQQSWTLIQQGPFSGRVSSIRGSGIFSVVSTSLPSVETRGVEFGQSVMVILAPGENLYARAFDGQSAVQIDPEFVMIASPPLELLTDRGGPSARLRVDVGQTGFFAGREFRTFKEWEVATTALYVIRATVPVDIILFELGINIEEGSARIETLVGGTPSGSFAEVLPIFGTNNMASRPTPFYTPVVVLEAGGGHTGGTLLDPLRAKTSGNSNFASSVGAAAGAERGVAAATYYFRVTLTGAIGVFKARWEERV